MNTRRLSVLFLTYNRADLLVVAVESIRSALMQIRDLTYQLVISDDASDERNRNIIFGIAVDRTISFERNCGLSHNHNKGLKACDYDMILSLQDDWMFVGTPSCVDQALSVLECNPDVGIVNFIPPPLPLPHTVHHLPEGAEYLVFENDGIDRSDIPCSARPYSDRPHLKRRAFVQEIGEYREDMPMTAAELNYQRRVACQTRWKVAYLVGDLPFVHLGSERSFNPGHLRAHQREVFYRLPVIGPVYKHARGIARRCRTLVLGGTKT